MGAYDQPTTADYAWASTRDNSDEIRILRTKVDELERRLLILERYVNFGRFIR